jgi:pimeloyl-ACP methyl ester carboxylesterase
MDGGVRPGPLSYTERQGGDAQPHDLERIAIPTTLIWGRHDLGVRLSVAEAASARYGWPLHVIENARDDPAIEQPEAFLEALRAALDVTEADQAVRR